jgi:hypothetical protein
VFQTVWGAFMSVVICLLTMWIALTLVSQLLLQEVKSQTKLVSLVHPQPNEIDEPKEWSDHDYMVLDDIASMFRFINVAETDPKVATIELYRSKQDLSVEFNQEIFQDCTSAQQYPNSPSSACLSNSLDYLLLDKDQDFIHDIGK